MFTLSAYAQAALPLQKGVQRERLAHWTICEENSPSVLELFRKNRFPLKFPDTSKGGLIYELCDHKE